MYLARKLAEFWPKHCNKLQSLAWSTYSNICSLTTGLDFLETLLRQQTPNSQLNVQLGVVKSGALKLLLLFSYAWWQNIQR